MCQDNGSINQHEGGIHTIYVFLTRSRVRWTINISENTILNEFIGMYDVSDLDQFRADAGIKTALFSTKGIDNIHSWEGGLNKLAPVLVASLVVTDRYRYNSAFTPSHSTMCF